jgi:hypothetical protein
MSRMTCLTFVRMPPAFQLTWVLSKGTHLTQCHEQEEAIALYYLPDGGRGFFVEVGVDKAQQKARVVRTFSSSEPLEKYAHGVRLPI